MNYLGNSTAARTKSDVGVVRLSFQNLGGWGRQIESSRLIYKFQDYWVRIRYGKHKKKNERLCVFSRDTICLFICLVSIFLLVCFVFESRSWLVLPRLVQLTLFLVNLPNPGITVMYHRAQFKFSVDWVCIWTTVVLHSIWVSLCRKS